MKKRFLALALAVVLILGLASPALAYSTPDFSDLPSDNWAYAPVMRMADQGYIQGTGNGAFSPEMKVSAAQFLTLVGRIVFPDTTVGATDTWYGPYVSVAQTNGLLTGTQVDVNTPEAEITRYDMAVILQAAATKLGKVEALAQQSQVTDFETIPNMYTEAVLAVYGMGLITGDQNGSFNGSNTMMRNELATVIDRLVALKAPGGSTTNPSTTTEPQNPVPNATYYLKVVSKLDVMVPGETTRLAFGSPGAPYNAQSSSFNRAGFACTSSAPDVVEVTGPQGTSDWQLTATGVGTATITVTDPYGVSGSTDITVVAERTGLKMVPYSIRVGSGVYAEQTTRGSAYTEYVDVPNVPFKIYYTKDNGKTSQLVYEGVASQGAASFLDLTIELPEDSFYGNDAGLYISAETTVNGQRMVTDDLRTDGRAYITVHKVKNGKGEFLRIPLTPPDGEKAHFTFKGYVVYSSLADGTYQYPAEFKVQLHLKDGTVVGEAITQGGGVFSMDCTVDAIDKGFDKYAKIYYVTAEGTAPDGTEYLHAPRVPLENYTMISLVDLEIESSEGGTAHRNYRVYISKLDIVEN